MPMTATEHFEKAEELLAKADEYYTDQKGLIWATRAQAHLDAARLLLDIETALTTQGGSTGTPAWRTGLTGIAEKRRTSSH
ncbi:hypothetical protein [Streptomyces achromogenes]|uniref:hypothetical protein n=1 Tax=Streptomyces achromogenes TaxID=67255 RepID=UPI003A7FD328